MDEKTDRLIQLIENVKAEYSKNYLTVAIPGFLSKKFVAYCSMQTDIETTKEYIALLRTETNQTIKSSLTYSLIALYAKCFTDATKANNPKLEASHVFKGNQELLQTHQYLIDQRHQFIAHRGETENEIGIAYLLVPKVENDEHKLQVRFAQLKLTAFNEDKLNSIEALMDYILEVLRAKVEEVGQELYDAAMRMFNADELASMLMNK